MKFSIFLSNSINESWYQHYLDYDGIKSVIDQIGIGDSQYLEDKFIVMIRDNYKKCQNFYNTKIEELEKIIESSEPDINYAMYLASEVYKYGILNRVGFYKIIKKHDRCSKIPILPYYSIKLHYNTFCKVEKIYYIFSIMSKKQKEIRNDMNMNKPNDIRYKYLETIPSNDIHNRLVAGETIENMNESESGNFIRKSAKFWILPTHVPEIINYINKYLPMYFFNDENLMQETTSIYLDSDSFHCYSERIQKSESAHLIRLRWYGDLKDCQKVYVEKKTHHEDWAAEKSSKDRFPIGKDDVLDFLMEKEFMIDKSVENMELVDDTKYIIDKEELRPRLATKYLRFAFQDNNNDFIRISIDTNLRMIKKNGNYTDWDETDNLIDNDSIHMFPYAVMEVKLKEPFTDNIPLWILALLDNPNVIKVDNFSKYAHGTYMLNRESIPQVPSWILEYPTIFNTYDEIEEINVIKRVSMISSEKSPDTIRKIKIDPKFIIQNEKSMFQWINVSLAMLKLSNNAELILMYALRSMSIVALTLGFYIYYKRLYKLKRGLLENFEENVPFGILNIFLFCFIGYSIIF